MNITSGRGKVLKVIHVIITGWRGKVLTVIITGGKTVEVITYDHYRWGR